MRYYIKQKLFSWRDRFYIKDEAGHDCYYAEGEVFSWTRKLHLYDMAGREVAFIAQEAWTWMPKYTIYRAGVPAARVCREFTFFHPRYHLEGADWRVDGSFWEHDYAMYCGNTTVATVQKEWFTWGDSYELDVADGWDDVLALSVLLTIDCVAAEQAANS